MSELNNITNSYNISDLSNIYKQIAVEPDILFDVNEEKQFLIECIQKVFDEKFLLIETNLLINDIDKLNNSFVVLLKFCYGLKKPYTQTHKVFLEYCDFFDLPYNKCFVSLHEKLQKLIKKGCIEMIGEKKFKKIDNINNPNKIFTLFDLVSPK
jgi:hypothetical protein